MTSSVGSLGPEQPLDHLGRIAKDITSNLYLYFEAVRDAPKRSEELRQEMGGICGLLDSLEYALTPSTKSSFKTPASFKEAIREFDAMLNDMNVRVAVSRTKGIARLKWPFTKDENERLLSRIERYKATFSAALNIKSA
jgi:hypothetical protein